MKKDKKKQMKKDKKKLRIELYSPCGDCKGEGYITYTYKPCETCGGDGEIAEPISVKELKDFLGDGE